MLDPKDMDFVFVVLKGRISIIHDERVFKKIQQDVRKSRRKQLELMQLKYAQQAEIENNPFAKQEEQEDFVSDFPYDQLKKQDYLLLKEGQTFGNDRMITNKKYRPSFAIA